MRVFILFSVLVAVITGCRRQPQSAETPWGTVVGAEDDSTKTYGSVLTFEDIVNQGEMIILTLSGPDCYYDYHGFGMGNQYLLCEDFAKQAGLKLRVEVCKDSLELITRLRQGDGDLVAYPIHSKHEGVMACGPDWLVVSDNQSLADTINSWYKPDKLEQVKMRQNTYLTGGGVIRHVYAPMIGGGVISKYDNLFMRYGGAAHIDWRLMAAQCYQESCFDPNARSFAGAAGLMQIMPSTAAYLGLPWSQVYDPESNIAASAKMMRDLLNRYSNIRNYNDRVSFALAAYNGGSAHVADARALARKYGKNPDSWADVSEFILKLQQPEYYRDPVVKYGYLRGSETYGYVKNIQARWAKYRGSAGGGSYNPSSGSMATPQRATKKYKYHI